jgi:predicted outer membrane protein
MKTSRFKTVTALAPVAILLAAPAPALEHGSTWSTTQRLAAAAGAPMDLAWIALRDTTPATEADFLTQAWLTSHADVRLSDLAAAKASRAELRELAGSIARDHRAMNQEIQRVAREIAVVLPPDYAPELEDEFRKIEKKEGHAFDVAWLREMEESHSNSIRRFHSAVVIAKEPPVKDLIAEFLPELRSHLLSLREQKAE